MKPFFPYYGSKWSTVPAYPAPRYGIVVEPFAGSACYAVRHAVPRAILCDMDPYIVGVWSYLIRASAEEIRRLPLIQPGQSVDDLGPLCQEAKWLIGYWVNCSAAPCKTLSKWGAHNLDAKPGSVWSDRTRDRIASQVDKIRDWEIRQGDCMAILDDVGEATWFIDPPYQTMGKHYRFGCKGIDFARLAEWCKIRPGMAIVCENEGAGWLPFSPLRKTRSAATCKTTNAEAVWCSDGWRPAMQTTLATEDSP